MTPRQALEAVLAYLEERHVVWAASEDPLSKERADAYSCGATFAHRALLELNAQEGARSLARWPAPKVDQIYCPNCRCTACLDAMELEDRERGGT